MARMHDERIPGESVATVMRPAVATLDGAKAMTVTGPDAASFLHGQLANDVTGLAVGGARRSLYLNHKGHAVAEVMVLRRGRTAFDLVEEGGAAGWVREELERHVVFDDVSVSSPFAVALQTVQGEGAAAVVQRALGVEPPGEGTVAVCAPAGLGEVAVWRRVRSTAGGFDLLADAAAGAALLAAAAGAGAVPVDAGGRDLLRVRAGVALAPQDAGDGVLPQEAGLEPALSYRKGCYLGQEIMARIEARGNLRRGLVRLTLAGDPRAAASGEEGWRELRAGGRVVGRLGTVAPSTSGYEALAVVRRDLPASTELVAQGGILARVHP